MQEMKRIMEEAQSKGSTELPAWLVENRDFRKFLKEAEKVRVLLLLNSLITFQIRLYVMNMPVIYTALFFKLYHLLIFVGFSTTERFCSS